MCVCVCDCVCVCLCWHVCGGGKLICRPCHYTCLLQTHFQRAPPFPHTRGHTLMYAHTQLLGFDFSILKMPLGASRSACFTLRHACWPANILRPNFHTLACPSPPLTHTAAGLRFQHSQDASGCVPGEAAQRRLHDQRAPHPGQAQHGCRHVCVRAPAPAGHAGPTLHWKCQIECCLY